MNYSMVDLSGLIENSGIMYVWTNQNKKSRDLEIKIREELELNNKFFHQKKFMT